MAVPKTAVHKNHGLVLWKHDVGFSRQSLVVKPEPEPGGMECLPDQYLWFGVFSFDGSHHAAAGGFVDSVSQRGPISALVREPPRDTVSCGGQPPQ